MAQRLLRDWTDSEKMNSLSQGAECLFVRLMMKADDFGSFHANPKLVKSLCFPLKDYRESDITRWMNELQKSGLIAFYEAESKRYLNILNFGQRLRNMRNAFPQPPEFDNSQQLAAIRSETPPEHEVEEEVEEEGEDARARTHTHEQIQSFENFKAWISKNAPRVNKLKKPFTIDEYLKVVKAIPKEQITELLLAMENHANLLKKNISAYLTITKWSKMNFENDKNINGKTAKPVSEDPELAAQRAAARGQSIAK